MDSSNEGRRLANKQESITSTARTNKSKRKKKVLEKKVVASSSSADGVLMAEVDSTFLDSCAAVEKAMGISLILQCVISKLNVPNLKSSRLVNKQWKEEADKQITRRGCFRLKFDPDSRPFNEGLKQLKFSKDLPCFDFHLNIPGSEMIELKKFLSLLGCRVKSLTLKSLIHEDSLSTLLAGLPNLEHLFLIREFLENGAFDDAQTSKLKIRGDLINLKHITFLPASNWYTPAIEVGSKVLEIVDKAPNLLSVNNTLFSSDLLNAKDASKWKGTVHLIKSFEWSEDIDIEIYASSGLQVENLSITRADYNLLVENPASLQKIVKSSQHSLKSFVTGSAFICSPKETGFGPAFLPFQNLKVLQIRVEHFMWNYLYRNDFESRFLSQFGQEAFPHLTTVILELPSNRSFRESTRELEYSAFLNAIESVVNLEFRGKERSMDYWEIEEHRMRRIKELFPNVKHLKLKDSFQISKILPFCFALWPELESLEFHVNFKGPFDIDVKKRSEKSYFEAMHLYDNLDVVFTGLPLKMCKRLRTAKPGKMLEEDIQVAQDINAKERSRNSLVFQSELKTLTVVFSDIRPDISKTECPISSVSCLYAFKLMPNLEVRVLYDQNLAKFNPETSTFEDHYNMEKYLAELAPHCEIGHWETGGAASLISKLWTLRA